MERNLYRVFFSISTSWSLDKSIKKILPLVIEVPDPYIGTDVQIKIFKRKASEKFKSRDEYAPEGLLNYIGNERIPDIPQTKNIEVDICIPSGEWLY